MARARTSPHRRARGLSWSTRERRRAETATSRRRGSQPSRCSARFHIVTSSSRRRRTARLSPRPKTRSASIESGPESEAAVSGPADHPEAVDRGQRDAERGEPRVQVPGPAAPAGPRRGRRRGRGRPGTRCRRRCRPSRARCRRAAPPRCRRRSPAARSPPRAPWRRRSRRSGRGGWRASLPLSSSTTPAASVTSAGEPEDRRDAAGRARRCTDAAARDAPRAGAAGPARRRASRPSSADPCAGG